MTRNSPSLVFAVAVVAFVAGGVLISEPVRQASPGILGLLALGTAAVAFARLRHAFLVTEHERGVLYRRGRVERVLEPGHHVFWGLYFDMVKLDVRESFVTLAGQEVLTRDGVTVKVSLVVRQRIVDPVVYVSRASDAANAAYLITQIALREAVGTRDADALLETRSGMGEEVRRAASEEAAALGIELRAVEVKDLMFPGELKAMMTEVVRARKQAQATLERARGEQAALRSLANAARLIEGNPALGHLRALQALGEAKNATVVLNVGPVSTEATSGTADVSKPS